MEEKQKNTFKPFIIIIVILVVLIGLFFIFAGNTGAVATVNGDTISQGDYRREYDQTLAALNQMENAAIMTAEMEETLKNEVIDQLIAEKLVLQYAIENNISATDEEFNQEYSMTVGLIGGEESLGEYLKSFKLSQESFEKDVRNQIIFRKSVESFVEPEKLEVTEEEVQIAYDQLVAQVQSAEIQQEVPPLETVKEWFKTQIKNQKISNEGGAFIEYLKGQAEIEILV